MQKIKSIINPDLPREGNKIVKSTVPLDFTVMAFHAAWMYVNMKAYTVMWPKNIYIGFKNSDMIKLILPVLRGHFYVIANAEDVDEWWMDFEDSYLIFYSPGA